MMSKINTRAEFIDTIEELLIEIDDSWEISGLSGVDFLERIQAYAKDIGGYYKNAKSNEDPNEASWNNFATIITGACNYE